MDISAQKIETWAPNAGAVKNGRDLTARQKFSNLHIDADKSLLWGECAGSGQSPYSCSADFIQENSPVFRCSCPSRQFPCKHCLGLLFAYVQGLAFSEAEVPEALASKREKAEKRQEKKVQEKESLKDKAARPQKVNASALVKKTESQLAGVEIAGKILSSVFGAGLSTLDAKERRNLQASVKELGNYYIPGVQAAFGNLLLELEAVQNEQYTEVIDQLNYIVVLLKKAREHLERRRENPEAPLETGSAIEEQIGYVWKLTELAALGLCEENAELVQLSFDCRDNPARREFVDEGAWLNLKSGRICKTMNYRPYRAVKYIREENSVSGVVGLRELYVYPGDLNPRIRWEPEARCDRAVTPGDLDRIRSFASENWGETFKLIKGSIKNPLADKNPLVLLAPNRAFLNGSDLVLEDKGGVRLTLRDAAGHGVAAELLKMVLPAEPAGLSLLVRIDNNVRDGLFTAGPLALVTPEKLIKLFY